MPPARASRQRARGGALCLGLVTCAPAPVPPLAPATIAAAPALDSALAERRASTAGGCRVVAGDAALLVKGTVLAPAQVWPRGEVLIEDGVITCVGARCTPHARTRPTQLDCGTQVISPGLVNLHDHLGYCERGGAKLEAVYEHRHEWRKGLRGRPALDSYHNRSEAGSAWCELRHLVAGTTSIVGGLGVAGLVRNLDEDSRWSVREQTFPLGDGEGLLREHGCAYPGLDAGPSAPAGAVVMHVGEGVDASASNELRCLLGRAASLPPRVAFVHAVAAGPAQWQAMAERGVSLVWSPRSNLALYGQTADVAAARRAGVRVALGTDWPATGSSSLLRELACARSYDPALDDAALWAMVTKAPAHAVGVPVGRLEVGALADLLVVSDEGCHAHACVTRAEPADVRLVLRDGLARYGDDELVAVLRPDAHCEPLDVCGSRRRVCLAETGLESLAALRDAVGATALPIFTCDAPPDEPACRPSATSRTSP